MPRPPLLRYCLLLGTAIALPLTTLPALAASRVMQPVAPANNGLRNWVADRAVTFSPRSDQPAPDYTVGGGSRSSGVCPKDKDSGAKTSEEGSPTAQTKSLARRMMPLVPDSESGVQFTVEAHPTLFVYVPPTSAKALELTLFHQEKIIIQGQEKKRERAIYQTTLPLTHTPGIVRFVLPPYKPALEVGKDYKWVVAIACKTLIPQPGDPFTERLIRRIQPDAALADKISKSTALERVSLYGQSGIWYEMLAELALLRQAQPNDPKVTAIWNDVLQSSGLGAIAPVPLQN